MTARGQTAAMFGCAGGRLGADEAAFFAEAQPFGFILFSRNVEGPDQLRRLCGDLRGCLGRDVPIFTDQEGGRIQRLRGAPWRDWMPPLDFVAKAKGQAARAMELRARLIARELRAVGINGNCSPVGDVARPRTHAFLRNRCYGTDPAQVAENATAAARGLMAEGVWPVMKHLPGHGRAELDSHHELPRTSASREELQKTDFVPFRAMAHLPFAMTAHMVYSAYDEAPATLSSVLIEVIRQDIGFEGVLLSDDLNMRALGGTLAQRTARALAAGCDLALHCKGDLFEMEEVAAAAGQIRAESAERITRAMRPLPDADAIDTKALEAELHALSA